MPISPETWTKTRSRQTHFTAEENAVIEAGFRSGRRPRDVARELKCAVRTIYRSYSAFRDLGGQEPTKETTKTKGSAAPNLYRSNFEPT